MSGPLTTASAEPTEPSALLAAATRSAGRFAALRLGRLEGGDLELLRIGSACVFRAGPFVIRVTPPHTSLTAVHAEATVARLLAKAGIATPPVVDPGYLDADGRVISAWKFVEHTDAPVDPTTVAQLLARINQVPPVGLEPVDLLAATRPRVAGFPAAGLTTMAEQALFEDALTRATAALDDVWGPPTCVVHGDVHSNNVLNSPHGPVVIDFECAGAGTPVLDLAGLEFNAARFPTELDGEAPVVLATYRELTGLDGAPPELQLVFEIRHAAWAIAGRAADPVKFAREAATCLDYLTRPRPAHG